MKKWVKPAGLSIMLLTLMLLSLIDVGWTDVINPLSPADATSMSQDESHDKTHSSQRLGAVQTNNPQNCCIDHGLPGDANSDGMLNLSDILLIIDFIYKEPYGSPGNPNGCNALLDVNGDGSSADNPKIDCLDIFYLIRNIYCDPLGEPETCCPPGCIRPLAMGEQ